MIAITPLYAGLLALFFALLSFRVIGIRRSARIALGDGGNILLTRRLRVHGNFAEYVPLVLILMLLLEIQERPDWQTHLVGASLMAGRILHAIGINQEPENYKIRTAGMIFTFMALITGGLANLDFGGLSALIASY